MPSPPWWAACRQCSSFFWEISVWQFFHPLTLGFCQCWVGVVPPRSHGMFMRESLVDCVYKICVGIVTSAWHLNVVRCHDSIIVASICCCLDGGCFYCSVYFVLDVNIFKGWVCGAQVYQGFYHGYWIARNCIGTFVPLAWAMLDAEGISEAFLL